MRHQMDFDPALLLQWAERLCLTTSDDQAEIAHALGIEGHVVGQERAVVDPPPAGTTWLKIVRHPADFVYLEMSLAGRGLTRAQLDAHLGEGRSIPRVHPYDDHRVAYYVQVAGASYKCALFAAFDRLPVQDAIAHEVTLRRD